MRLRRPMLAGIASAFPLVFLALAFCRLNLFVTLTVPIEICIRPVGSEGQQSLVYSLRLWYFILGVYFL